MATPIAHIVLTDKVFGKYFKDKNKKDFFIGTSFPDIRYLANIEKKTTHLSYNKEKNSFKAGMRFHSLIDEIWNKFVRSNDNFILYSKSRNSVNDITSLKLLEDELLYGKINNWKQYIKFFDEVLSDELSFNIPEKKIKKWHKILQKYFLRKPNDSDRENLLKFLGFSKEIIDEMNHNVNLMKNDQIIVQAIMGLYNDFESILIKYDQFASR